MVKRICKQCGNEFETRPALVKYGYGNFCSQKCSGKYNYKNNDKIKSQLAKYQNRGVEKVKLVCQWCNKDFEVVPSRKDTAKFCCRSCQVSYRNTITTKEKIAKKCLWCKKDFEVYPSQKRFRYCSLGCRTAWRNSNEPPKGNTFGIGGYHLKTNGSKIWMRSSWEREFAELLDKLSFEWEYEPKVFRLSNGLGYTPDFYIATLDKWVEIKGFWRDKESKEKVELFKKEYCSIDVVVGREELDNYKIELSKGLI